MALPQSNKELYDKLLEAITEVEILKTAFEESKRLLTAEKKALEATRQVADDHRSSSEELLKGTNLHEEFLKNSMIEMKKDVEFLNSLLEKVIQELHEASDEKLSLGNQLVETNLSEKILHAVELLQKYKKERDHAVQEAKELKNQLAYFSFSDIHKATNSFDPDLVIGEGGKGVTYKGVLHHINVAITILSPNIISGSREFEQQVYVLSKLRHPNIVTLIGICFEPKALVFEYLSRGSLEDRLMCKDNSPPLPWKTRIQIATQLCSVLTFLHSRSPSRIIHGNLKPENILLNDRFLCKLHNFDPKILAAEELSPATDVCAFGIILLRLLTGKLAFALAMDVKDALDRDDLTDILDHSAGNFPYVQAKQLASMALRCCDSDPTVRPDLNTEVWRILESMQNSSQPLSRLKLDPEEQVPYHFLCPISQEIMKDPHFAADGFTYDARSIKNWLNNHSTSPLTNLKLENKVLIPNRSLQSAIEEWLPNCPNA